METLFYCSILVIAKWRHLSTHIFACPSMSWDHELVSLGDGSQPSNGFPCLLRERIQTIFKVLRSRCVHPKHT